ncbi:MAG: hypothetical protein FJZ01_11855 [Candidatus Sericytochromatia bacterium]|nr:hypothetical protein [Candidatus Tanganyikabacteria bacterium]
MRRAVAFLAAILAFQAPALAAEPYDAATMGLGGTFLTRSVDANSPYFNPANLTNARGYFYLGSDVGLLLGNNAVAVGDIWGAIQTEPTGNFATFVKGIGALQSFQLGMDEAIKKNLNPGDPPSLAMPKLPDEMRGYLRGDAGILGITYPWGGHQGFKRTYFDPVASKDIQVDVPARPHEYAFAYRNYVRLPGVNFFVTAPQLLSAADGILKVDAEMARELIKLNKEVQDGTLDVSALPDRVKTIKTKLNDGLAPLLGNDGASLTLGVDEGAYLTNALSYQMPLSVIPGVASLLASQSVLVGATARIHTTSGLVGVNPLSSVLGSALPGVQAGFPGRLEMINTFRLKDPVAKLNSALDNFASNPGSSSVVTEAASDFLKAYEVSLVSHVPGPVGVSLDFGASAPLPGGFTVAAMLQNAPTYWPGQKITYANVASGSAALSFREVKSESTNFSYTEPLGIRLGVGWEQGTRAGGFGLSAEVAESFDGPASSNYLGRPSLNLGASAHFASMLYGRLGTQIGGKASLVGAGVGLDLGFSRIDLAGGIEPDLSALKFDSGFGESLPQSMRGVGLALSFNLGI